MGGTVNVPNVGSIDETTNIPVTVLAVKFPHASWVVVMIALPAPTTVTRPSDVTVATPDSDASIVYMNAPLLSVIGAVRLNAAALKFLVGTVNVPKVGSIGETTNTPVTVLAVKFPHASWTTEMVALPAPTTVTSPPDVTVATVGALLEYVNAPLLSVVGAVRLNAASLKFFPGTVNVPKVGAMGETTKAAVTVLAVKFPDASWVAVIVALPVSTTVTRPPDVTVATDGALLEYVNTPLLSVVGAVKLNDASLKFLPGTVNVPNVGAMGETTKAAVTLPLV